MSRDVLLRVERTGEGCEKRKRERKRALQNSCLFLRETASKILAADWSSHYAVIKQHGVHYGLLDSFSLVRRQLSDLVNGNYKIPSYTCNEYFHSYLISV